MDTGSTPPLSDLAAALLGAAANPLVLLGAEDRIVAANPAFLGLMRLEEREVVGEPLETFLSPVQTGEVALRRCEKGSCRARLTLSDAGGMRLARLDACPGRSAPEDGRRPYCGVENRLQESEELFHHITDHVDDLIALVDTEGRRVFNSASYRRVLGDPSVEVGQDSFSAIHPDDRGFIKAVFRQVVETGQGARVEYRYLLRDGSVRYVESLSSAIFDAQGKVVRVLVVGRDVTERRQAEEILRESEERFRQIAENIRDVFWMSVPDKGRMLYVSPAYERVWGRSVASLYDDPRSFAAAIHPDDRERIFAAFPLQADGGYDVEYRVVRPDGSIRWVHDQAFPVRDAEGRVYRIAGIASDITDRREAEEAVRAASALQQAIMRVTTGAILYIRDRRVQWMNDGWCNMVGYSREELVGQSMRLVFPSDEAFEASRDAIYHEDGRARSEPHVVYYQRKNGEMFPALVTGAPIDPEHPGEGNVFSLTDITPLVEAQEEVRRLNEDLARRVEERTAELTAANRRLTGEIAERERLEAVLRARAEQIRLHRNVLLDLARLDKGELPSAMAEILKAAATTLGVERVSFWRLSEAGDGITCEAMQRLSRLGSDPAALGLVLPAALAPTYFAALADNHPLVIGDALSDPRSATFREGYLVPHGIGAMLDVPVWHQGRMVGVLCHEHTGGAREWTPEEVDFASAMANLLSLALEAAQRQSLLEALQRSEEKYRLVVENANEGIVVAQDGLLRFANAKAMELTGFALADLSEKPFLDIIHPDDRERVGLNYQRRLRGEAAENNYHFRILRGDKTQRWLHISAVLIEWEGRPATLNFVSDITERKLAEEALRRSRSRFVAVFNNAAVGIGVVDPQGRIIEANTSWVKMLGYSPAEARRLHVMDITHPDDVVASQEKLDEILSGQVDSYRIEKRYLRKDGTPVWADVSVTPIMGLDGNIEALVAAFVDVTERKRAEEDIRRALEKERELGELKSKFVSMTSHEFRTPLATILSSAELLEHYVDRMESEERLELLHSITLAVRRMTGMLEDVLMIGKAEAGKLVFKPEPVDLDALCARLVEEMRLHAGEGRRLSYSGDCGCGGALMDEKLLRHIFTNLLSNAIKYTREGGEIAFRLACQGSQVRVEVEDQGIGIPAEDQARLFETFHRASNVGNLPGTGLGLSIVKQAVELHGGSIEVESEEDKGSRFTVWLPLGV